MPTRWGERKIAVIGEAPGADDVRNNIPFSGSPGYHFELVANQAQFPVRQELYMGNVLQHRPSGDFLGVYKWDGPEVQNGLQMLRQEIQQLKPNIVVLLGHLPLKAARDPKTNHFLGITKKQNPYKFKVGTWRGSLFVCDKPDSPFFGFKCVASYHPSYLLRSYEDTPLSIFDFKRANEESKFPTLHLPARRLITSINADEIIERLRSIRANRTRVAADIEGGLGDMSCISFATNPFEAFIIPFYDREGHYRWKNNPVGPVIWRELALTLEDPAVPKIFQNGLYDLFVLGYGYGIRVQGLDHDTMLSGWEIYSQLEKGLDIQTSIYTREPYYKSEYKAWATEDFYRYCCKDSAVTYEISSVHRQILTGDQLKHFQSNLANLEPMLAMELAGMRYDIEGAAKRRAELLRMLYEKQARLNLLSGYRFKWTSLSEIFTSAKNLFGMVRKLDVINDWSSLLNNCKKGPENKRYAPCIIRLVELLKQPNPTLATIGEIEDICEVGLNVDGDDFENYVYNELKLPIQYNENEKGEKTVTTDYEALLRLSKECQQHPTKYGPVAEESIKLAIEIRALLRRSSMLEISADRDGRIRCGYNIVGSYTGRVTSYKSPTGSGYNLQTIPNYTSRNEAPGGILGDRDLFLADDDYWFFQCDLKGADGWTVAAYCAMLGDPTMLEDYNYGLKPHNILALKLRGVSANYDDREELKYLCHPSRFDKEAWDVFACKRVFHGGNYLEGGLTISKNILTDSEGKLWMSAGECDSLKKNYMFRRYPGIQRWHAYVEDKLRRIPGIPYLIAASGQKCFFFSRPQQTLTKAVAFEPQANTTYATNQAMLRLWGDPENRVSELLIPSRDGVKALRIQPLHQVHDALCGQFRKSDTSWAINKIQSYFNNPLIIAGRQMIIPFDGGYGRSWGETKEGKI